MNDILIVKLSGEYFAAENNPLNINKLKKTAQDLMQLHQKVAIVLGGGNIWRKRDWENNVKLDDVTSDHVGMHATVINAYALNGVFNKLDVHSQVINNLMPNVFQDNYYLTHNIINKLFQDYDILIFAGGTSLPFFSTDTTTILTALKCHATAIYMGKSHVNGVYDKDPNKYNDAHHYPHLTFRKYLAHGLEVIDPAAIALCLNSNFKIYVFDIENPGLNFDAQIHKHTLLTNA